MSSQTKRTRRTRFCGSFYDEQLFDAHIDRIVEEATPRNSDIVFELRLLRLLTSPTPHVVDGWPCEIARGERVAARLRFVGGRWLWRGGGFERLDELPADAGARRLFGVSRFRQPGNGEFYWISAGTEEPGENAIAARACVLEIEEETPETVEVVRHWACAPAPTPGLPPYRPVFHPRFGGDSITIYLGRRALHRRLFIGGLHHQYERRPSVDHVLNLCGISNPWCEHSGEHPADRFSPRGEGPSGMSLENLLDEACWVAERVREGKRVLVHCYAGMNRSTTVCCAALILLEGISAEEALARVRRRHPLAWPDPYHWFTLRWLARAGIAGGEAEGEMGEAKGASLLREVSAVG